MIRPVPLEPPATDDPETSRTPPSPDDPDEEAWAELTRTQFVTGYADADGIYDVLE